jgi:outer membrane biosynthesis protein TonB
MRSPAKFVLWLLPFLLTGCIHWPGRKQTQPVAPPVATTTAPKPTPTPEELPPSATTIPTQPLPSDSKPIPEPPPKKPVKHKKPAPAPPPAPEQAASPAPNPSVSAIGQLSTGEAPDLQKQTVDALNSVEHELNGINRGLSETEQKTAGQIREFIKQARAALTSGDVDGAQTLTAKAKVLLGELNK